MKQLETQNFLTNLYPTRGFLGGRRVGAGSQTKLLVQPALQGIVFFEQFRDKTLERGAVHGQDSFFQSKTEKKKLTFSLNIPHTLSSSCGSPEQRSVRGASHQRGVSIMSLWTFLCGSCILSVLCTHSILKANGELPSSLPFLLVSRPKLGGMDAVGMQPSLACSPQPFVVLCPLLLRASFHSSDSHGYVLWPCGLILPQTTSESLGD